MEQFWQENGYISLLVNTIPGIENKSYLELGLGRGVNFSCIKAARKVSVDIQKETKPTFQMSTDAFFEQNAERFDIVFIDADHSFNQVVKDFNHTLLICNDYLFLHDMVPPVEELTTPPKCGDAYKLLFCLVEIVGVLVYTLDSDCGLSFIRMPMEAKQMDFPSLLNLDYQTFHNWLNRKHHQYSLEKMLDILKGTVN